ncbi:alanine aminotransferase 2-like [Gopherus evgoodei]|uniref:alanine aminotransferase 2-like n=1 Tax=Gopherus evgoodei TaxID=1825980 RepID=UPI0011CFAC71|nr:alanine aminotransferase 2-like [Gopherus evgoodei]
MAAGRKVLILDSVNPCVKGTRLPTLAPLLERASEIQHQLAQVAAVCAYPELLHANSVTGRQARVAHYLERRDGGIRCHPRNTITCGGITTAIVDPSRAGVLLPVPGHPLFADAVVLAGAVAVQYHLDEEGGWALDAGEIRQVLGQARGYCTPKVLCVINPGDPTGHVLSRRHIQDVLQLAAQERLLLLADEVHQESMFTPDSRLLSFKRVLCELGPMVSSVVQLISFYSISKGFALDGVVSAPGLRRHFSSGGSFGAAKDPERTPCRHSATEAPDRCQLATEPLSPFLMCQVTSGGRAPSRGQRGSFQAGFFELVNINPAIMKCFCSWGMSIYPLILGQFLLDALMEPSLPGSPPARPSWQWVLCAARAVVLSLGGCQETQVVLSDLAHKAQLTQEIFSQVPGIHCNPVQGAMYSFPRIQIPARAVQEAQALGLEPDFFFCQKLLEATGIVLAPGSTFGQCLGTHHVRVTLLPPVKMLRIVLQTITDFHFAFLQRYS